MDSVYFTDATRLSLLMVEADVYPIPGTFPGPIWNPLQRSLDYPETKVAFEHSSQVCLQSPGHTILQSTDHGLQ